jgi:hypothetical protein
MTRELQAPTVAGTTAVLADLEAKRSKLLAFAEKLSEARKSHAYKAHAVDDPNAKRKLAEVIEATTTNDGVLKSLDEAITEARLKVTLAQAYEQDIAAEAKAKAALELLGAFKEAGHELDDALRTIGEMGNVIANLLTQLQAHHRLKYHRA